MEKQEPKRDADRTIQSILEASTTEFASRGFSGARVDAIAASAGVNKATIYYHIGNKEKLYLEVIRRQVRGVTDQLVDCVQATSDPEEQLRVYIRFMVKAVAEREHLAPILMRELASGARSFPKELGEDLVRLFGIVAGILERGYRAGVFVASSPFAVHFMVMGFSLMFRMTEPIRSQVPRLKQLFEQLGSPDMETVEKELEERILRSVCINQLDDSTATGGQI